MVDDNFTLARITIPAAIGIIVVFIPLMQKAIITLLKFCPITVKRTRVIATVKNIASELRFIIEPMRSLEIEKIHVIFGDVRGRKNRTSVNRL